MDNKKPFHILINTYGAPRNVALAMHDVIKGSKCPVITVNLSRIYKSAVLILLAGNQRFAMPHSEIVWGHESHCSRVCI